MISDLISLMSPSDEDQFLQTLSNRDKRKTGRSVQLFKALKKGNEKKFKEQMSANAYNVLKMRLGESLIEFMSERIFENELTEEAGIIRKLALARKMVQLGKLKSGRKILEKAEQHAKQLQHYTLLNEIYHSLIEISHEATFAEQQALIQKLESNSNNFLLQERLNLVFTQVKRAFVESEQGKEQIDLDQLIQSNFKKYTISEANGYSIKSLYQLATILDYAAAQSRSYHTIDLFFANKLTQLNPEEIGNKRNHLYHIDLLYLLANIHFRRRAFDRSFHYLSQMHQQLTSSDRTLYIKKIVRYHLLMALNQNFTGKATAALETLNQIEFSSKEDTIDRLQVVLTRIMILTQLERFNEAKTLLASLYHTDGYYKRISGLEWVINKRFLEIILHIETGNTDFAFTRIENLTRQNKEFFTDKANLQVKPFLRVMKHYLNRPDQVHSPDFLQFVERTIPWKESHEDDIFFISVYGWLKAKMTRKSIYPVTLDLIQLVDRQTL